jgi:hypothetical protein
MKTLSFAQFPCTEDAAFNEVTVWMQTRNRYTTFTARIMAVNVMIKIPAGYYNQYIFITRAVTAQSV